MEIGKAELGNWNPDKPVTFEPVRAFTGRMDEFLLYDRVLNQDEIMRHYMMEFEVKQ